MLYLPKLLILLLQLLLVDPVALDFGKGALVVEVIDSAVDFGMEVMVVLEEFELARSVSAEGAGGREGGGLERLDVLVVVSIYHSIDQRIFAVFDLDVFCGFHLATREAYVEGNVVSPFV